MKYYLDITLLPEADITLGFLWQKVYQQVHIALVENKIAENQSAIAVSFPRYSTEKSSKHAFPLGNQLRLLAKEESQLTKLNISKWLSRLEDYVHIKSIKPVPDNATHIAFVRQQVKGDARIEKDMLSKAQRWAEKSGQPLDACLTELEKTKPKADNSLPFIWLESQETKQRNTGDSRKFPLFIKRVGLEEHQTGVFNCYGLSSHHNKQGRLASIPQF
ncbi:CRISPR-associated endonuclease Cas6/Csy4 [Pseudoalteromonas haloplanktis]|uniref:CRISPR-associated endonuclease Cas6/Csy4 n=1 Tax=Pseudoalteromonas haloplanktis TaxID=228 RepID=A0A9W4QS89_PSEHA|nr:type I-F CRISPR-associated endoribonuclease Cas6/Csy4 [Pseudoalteromonas haloplanktis]CAH9050919.1 CRISPR-associated endonuclease Cas6/Csy4 [Pseudoalteromonas haloplanktis]|tara:strand:- start:2186 stop:2839 length:654 start_codon:yes stop_codon:yes gene_type:complete